MTPQDSRTLRVAVGQSIADVEHANRIPFHLDRLVDNSSVTLDEVVSVVYDHPLHGFELPPTRFVMISQAAGTVTGVDTSPQLHYLSLSESLELAHDLLGPLSKAHWSVVRSYPSDLRLLEKLVADPNRRGRFEKDCSELRAENVHVRIYIKEAIGIGLEGREPPARGHLFLTNVDISDPALASTMTEKVYEMRRKRTGSINQSLPLSVWLDQPSTQPH